MQEIPFAQPGQAVHPGANPDVALAIRQIDQIWSPASPPSLENELNFPSCIRLMPAPHVPIHKEPCVSSVKEVSWSVGIGQRRYRS